MLRRWCLYLLLLSGLAALADTRSNPPQSTQKRAPTKLPVSTSSTRARNSFEKAMREFEQYRIPETLQDLRAATQADPNFAQAFILLSHMSPDPQEQSTSRTRAQQLARKVSASEQLLIRWLAGAQENDYLPAISAMNDLLAKYPRDQRLAYLAGDWLMKQQRYEQAVTVLERALALFPDYAAALNDVAYGYADLETSTRRSPPWTATWPSNRISPTRMIPTERFCAWPASSMPRSSNTAPAFELIRFRLGAGRRRHLCPDGKGTRSP